MGVTMEPEEIYAKKAEMFRTAIDKQADEEIALSAKEIRSRKSAAGKAKAQQALSDALSKVRAERSAYETKFKKELSRCGFQTTKAVRAHRKELIDGFFEELKGELAGFAESDKYSDYLKRSLAKAGKELGRDFVVLCAPKDAERLKKLTTHEVREEISIIIGGISALDEQNGLYADFTLDSALESERVAFTDKPELRL